MQVGIPITSPNVLSLSYLTFADRSNVMYNEYMCMCIFLVFRPRYLMSPNQPDVAGMMSYFSSSSPPPFLAIIEFNSCLLI
jgi:hypothetical protein